MRFIIYDAKQIIFVTPGTHSAGKNTSHHRPISGVYLSEHNLFVGSYDRQVKIAISFNYSALCYVYYEDGPFEKGKPTAIAW